MAGRLSNSFALVKASAEVLRMDKELLLFPLMSSLATILVTASFVAPMFMMGPDLLVEGETFTYAGYVYGFLFYLAQYFVIFFFNAALVGAALIRLEGGNPTLSDGLAIATKRVGAILGYAVIAATVGMILRFLAERAGWLGRIIVGLIGVAWTLTTYLTVPVLVTKDIGPIDAVKESAKIFKRTWGEQVVGNFSMSTAIFVMGLVWTVVSIGGTFFLIAPLQSAPLMLLAVATTVLGYIALALFSTAMQGVYTAALYRFAMTGDTGHFDASIMGNAFRPKK
ncbi:MAG TPA: DUF6159 family protein [Longimicrobiales bacterium]|nr:DUF6159 family protein [Longimicrobiales bacterium]